jgi:mono/diheme cytochrome c family protein/sugar lactone lactonase YvrE
MKEGTPTYMSPEETLKGLKTHEKLKGKDFASEEMFPEMANPVIMNVGPKGRLWVAAWPTYPKWEPLKEMNDSLMILPDEDRDGVADKAITFAKVHNPTGFTFWNGGVIVASQPDILFLRDTDGDDVADERIVLLTGLDSADTHHAASHLIVGPDGGLYFQSGVFFVNNVETPWRENFLDKSSSLYRLDLKSHKFWRHAPNSPNPHGVSFDYWGYHYITDGTGGRGYQVKPNFKGGFDARKLYDKKVRPVPSHGIISSTHFPDEMQGDLLVCNSIGYLGMKHYRLFPNTENGEVISSEQPDILYSEKDRNFRPTDVKFGSDGAMYVSDWSNVIIGHMQHNIRDPNRDHTHGRIYRFTYEGRPLQQHISVHNKPLPALLDLLKHPTDGVRERARAEISKHSTDKVIAATKKWMAQFNPKSKDDAHHLLEALWTFQRNHVQNDTLLNQLLNSPEPNAVIAAKTVQHYWNGKAELNAPAKPKPPKYKRPKGLAKEISDKEWKLGKEVFEREGHCMTCHQPHGKGLPKMYPPLAKSQWVTGDPVRLIKIALNGMMGKMEVNGEVYGAPGMPPMTPFRDLLKKDNEMAAVLTFVRNSWGNKASKITADQVKKVRAEMKGNINFINPDEILKEHPFK